MATRGRRPGFRMSDEHRTKIANSQILKCLMEHVEGKRKMSATQVTAGVALLRKVLPDLSQTTIDGSLDMRPAAGMTDDELAAIAAGRSTGIADAPRDPHRHH